MAKGRIGGDHVRRLGLRFLPELQLRLAPGPRQPDVAAEEVKAGAEGVSLVLLRRRLYHQFGEPRRIKEGRSRRLKSLVGSPGLILELIAILGITFLTLARRVHLA